MSSRHAVAQAVDLRLDLAIVTCRSCSPTCRSCRSKRLRLASSPVAEGKHRRAPSNAEIDAFELRTFDGHPVKLGALRRAVTLINVWTDSCPPCLKELPALQKLADLYGERRDVAIVALSFDPSGEHPATPTEKALAEAKRLGLKMPLVWDPAMRFMKLSKTGTLSFPVTFIVDGAGQVTEEIGFDETLSEEKFLQKKKEQIEHALRASQSP